MVKTLLILSSTIAMLTAIGIVLSVLFESIRFFEMVPLRAQVGMVFLKPNPFPKSIYDNIAYGSCIHGLAQDKTALDEIVESSLVKAGLWDEVKDRLNEPGTGLSGGQL